MRKPKVILTLLIFALIGGAYFYVYRDSFRKRVIHVSYTKTRLRGPARPNTPPLLTFTMHEDFGLTYVRVVKTDELKTNKYPHALWEMIADTNTARDNIFTYGQNIRGMHPAVAGTRAVPLETNVQYRLFVEAGKLKGQCDFMIPGETNAPGQPGN